MTAKRRRRSGEVQGKGTVKRQISDQASSVECIDSAAPKIGSGAIVVLSKNGGQSGIAPPIRESSRQIQL